MRQLLFTLVCSTALLPGLTIFSGTADARHFGGGGRHANMGRVSSHNVNRNINRNVTRNVNRNVNRSVDRNVNRNVNRNVDRNVNRNVSRDVNRRYAYHNGRRGYWRNGVWVALPVAAGAAGYAASCAYEYNRWQSTGSSYWRDRYYQCAR
jgi:hypothetical protein